MTPTPTTAPPLVEDDRLRELLSDPDSEVRGMAMLGLRPKRVLDWLASLDSLRGTKDLFFKRLEEALAALDQSRATIATLTDRVTVLEAERDRNWAAMDRWRADFSEAHQRANAAEARVTTLREALKDARFRLWGTGPAPEPLGYKIDAALASVPKTGAGEEGLALRRLMTPFLPLMRFLDGPRSIPYDRAADALGAWETLSDTSVADIRSFIAAAEGLAQSPAIHIIQDLLDVGIGYVQCCVEMKLRELDETPAVAAALSWVEGIKRPASPDPTVAELVAGLEKAANDFCTLQTLPSHGANDTSYIATLRLGMAAAERVARALLAKYQPKAEGGTP